MQGLQFLGDTPKLDGETCQGFICESPQVNGVPICSASVTYVKFGDVWHLLCFDPGIVHWRALAERPKPQSFKEAHLEFVHADVGLLAGILGVRMRSCEFSAVGDRIRAIFVFENNSEIVIEHAKHLTDYSYKST